jgi:hypothetical protein
MVGLDFHNFRQDIRRYGPLSIRYLAMLSAIYRADSTSPKSFAGGPSFVEY